MPRSRYIGLERWWHGLAGSGDCGFFGFWSGLRGGVGVCRGLMRRRGGVGWGGVGWGEWFVHERAEHVCKEAEYSRWAYKSNLRDSISKWSPRGKNATSDKIRPWKPSL